MAEFVLGCAQLGLEYGVANRHGKPSLEAALRLVERALQAGVHCFDVARAYGEGEERLGKALAGQNAAIVTKLSPLSDLAPGDSPRDAARAAECSIAQSCEALGRNHLPVLLLHRAGHRTAFEGAVWQRLKAFQAEGVIGRLGISAQSAQEAVAALADCDVRHIQIPFNLADHRWDEFLAEAGARCDVTIHVRSVFLQGLLAAGDSALWPQIEGVEAAALVARLNEICRCLKRESLVDLCLAFVRGVSVVDGAVIGLETEAQLARNLELFARPALTPPEMAYVREMLPRLPEQLLNPALWPRK